MLKITGIKSKRDIALLKDFSMFVLTRFVSSAKIRKTPIRIRFCRPEDMDDKKDAKDFRENGAWVEYQDGEFDISLNLCCLNKRSKEPLTRYKNLMKYLAHELIHVKQYLTKEMRDLQDGRTWYKGKIYTDVDKIMAVNPVKGKWKYFESPWELDAYSRMEGMYHMYLMEKHG